MSRPRRLAAAERRASPRRPRSAERGMVLLETAIAIPMLAAVAVTLAWGISIGGAALSLGDATRSAARELARGEAQGTVLDRARTAEPEADFTVAVVDGQIEVSAARYVAPPIPLLDGFGVTVRQRAVVPGEWS